MVQMVHTEQEKWINPHQQVQQSPRIVLMQLLDQTSRHSNHFRVILRIIIRKTAEMEVKLAQSQNSIVVYIYSSHFRWSQRSSRRR